VQHSPPRMKGTVLLLVLSLLSPLVNSINWADCGIPLTREISYTGVTAAPTLLNVSSAGTQLSANVQANLLTSLISGSTSIVLQVLKDGQTYLNVGAGDLCSILQTSTNWNCPLSVGPYSLSFIYQLPPLPTGDYVVKIIAYDQTSTEIGCLAVETSVLGLQTQTCDYTSSLSADLIGSTFYANNTIQIGPLGPQGQDLGYTWGTFVDIHASVDLTGEAPVDLNGYVWGLTGVMNKSVAGYIFQGTFVVGYLPNPAVQTGAILIEQGTFSWQMTPNPEVVNPPYLFQQGTVSFNPTYSYPTGFPYPLAFGNLNPFQVVPSSDGNYFSVTGQKTWCTCGCSSSASNSSDASGDKIGSAPSASSGGSGPNWRTGTIVLSTLGSIAVVLLAGLMVYLWRREEKPPAVYDDSDMMDPRKPDYGAIAINEIFEDHRDYL